MKRNSLNFKIWKYLTLFSIVILSFLWIFQVFFLNKYYEYVKKKDIKYVAKNIKKNEYNDDFSNQIDKIAYNKGVCVEIVNSDGNTIYLSGDMNQGCLNNSYHYKYKNIFVNSGKDEVSFELINPKFKNKALVYAIKLNNNFFAFVNTSLDPIDSTVSILTNQLIYVSIIVLVFAFIIAYFISKNISEPIIKINNSAKKIANGNFDVSFDIDGNIDELNELAHTLNYAKNELSKTDQLRRDLMANVSHDLKTPLTMIKAYAEMTSDLNLNKPDKIKKDMKIINDEVDRLTILVNDILSLSKMQAKINNCKYENFDIVVLTNDILNRYNIFVERDNYCFKFNYNASRIFINADRKMIEQVIYNLINNAINHTNNKVVEININDNNDEVIVEIKDFGDGISKDEIPYIWDKYYKCNKNYKRSVIGTGLGLSIVKNILEIHNFSYGVNSTVKKETTFFFKVKKNTRND